MQVPHRSYPALESRSLRDRMPDAVESTALVLFGLSILILVSLLLDPPSRTVRGAGGGFFLSREPFLLLGAGTYLVAGLVGFWSAIIFFKHRIHNLALKAFGVVLTAVTFSTLLSLGSSEWMTEVYYGGYVGSFVKQAFEGVSPLISMPLIGILFLIAVVFATDWFFYELIKGDDRDSDLSAAGRRLVPGVSADEERALIVQRPAVRGPVAVEEAPEAEPDEEPWADEEEFAAPAEEEEEDIELESEPEPPAPPAPAESTGPRIMRRIYPELEPVQPVAEREEEEPEFEPEREAPAAFGEAAPEEEEAEAEESPAAATATDWAGFKLFLPDTDDEESEQAPREFAGRIAAYVEESEEEESEEAEEEETLDEEPAERMEPELEAELESEFEVELEADEEEPEAVLEEEEDEEAPEALEEAMPVAAAPEVVADWAEEDEDYEEDAGDVETELLETEAMDAAEEEEFEVIATLEEPHRARPLEDVEDEDYEEDAEEDEDEVIRIEFEEDAEDEALATGPGPDRMLYSEAFHGGTPVAVEPDEVEEADRAEFDPFADAPVTGSSEEEAAPEPRTRRSRRAAARLELAIEDLIPSLDRMKKKIADLETEPAPGEAAGDRIYALALDTVFRSRRASTGLLQKELDLDARTAAGLLERMESEGVVGPRRDKRGNRKVLISRREFEELRSTGQR